MTDRFKEALDALNNSYKRIKRDDMGDIYKEELMVDIILIPTIHHALTLAQEAEQNKGEISDGYHTFNELYEHRHSLFCALTKAYPEKSWKSKFHSDGTMFDGWFIAGIDTNKGNATYHLPISWWNDFEIDELTNAPEWDGHTSNDVISRIKTLSPKNIMVRDGHGDLIDPQEFFPCQECKTKDEYLDIIRQEAEQLRKERDELARLVRSLVVEGCWDDESWIFARKVSEKNGNA